MPSACEVDICGVVGMYALQLASGTPSALLDWNNNYGDDPNKAVCFHCSNLPKHFFQDVRMDFQEIIAGTVGKENTFGTVVGRVKPGGMSFARFSTDDTAGVMRGYVGEGAFTSDSLNTFGGVGVVQIGACKSCCTTSAKTVSSITWLRTSRLLPARCMRLPFAIWAGRCTGTQTEKACR
jgi:L-fucose isomerase-like protein